MKIVSSLILSPRRMTGSNISRQDDPVIRRGDKLVALQQSPNIILIATFITLLISSNIAFAQDVDEKPDCAAKEAYANEVIERIGYCEQDSDCISKEFGCPFSCGSPINKNEEINVATKAIFRYRKHCGECEYECMPPEGKLACVYGKCVFEDEK